MEDDEEIVRELQKLDDLDGDLFLGDVDAEEGIWPGTKRGGKYGKRGRGTATRGGRPNRPYGRPQNSRDLNNFDNWDLEHEDANAVDDELIFDTHRGGFARGRARPFERREVLISRNAQKSFGRGKQFAEKARFEDYNKLSDAFDIEGKPGRTGDRISNDRNPERVWNRDPRDAAIFSRQLAMDEQNIDKSGFTMHRKDPRMVGKLLEPEHKDPRANVDSMRKDPRLATQQQRGKPDEGHQVPYDVMLKDPRLMAQQVEKLRREKEAVEREIAEKLAQGKNAQRRGFVALRDPRKQENVGVYNKVPSEKTIFEKISISSALLGNQIPGLGSDVRPPEPRSRTAETRRGTTVEQGSGEFVRRGPRSPSPIQPPSPDRNVRERSPRSPARRSSRWERSPSPRSRHERKMSPHRRSGRRERSGSGDRRDHRDRSSSGDGRRDHRDRSGSTEGRRERRDRSESGDGRRERRDWSGSPRRERSRRGERSRTPPRRRRSRSRSSSPSRDAKPPPHVPSSAPIFPPSGQPGYDMAPPPPTIYPDQYQPPPGFVAPPNGFSHPSPMWIVPNFACPTPGNLHHRNSSDPNNLSTPPLQSCNPSDGVHFIDFVQGPPPYAQYQPQPPPPPQQQQYHYENYGYPQQQPYGEYQQPPGSWGPVYPDMSQPPPAPTLSQPAPTPPAPPPPVLAPPVAPPPPKMDVKAEEAKKEAIKNEVLQQKQTLSRQREEYVRKSAMISRELKLLKDQENELREENSRDNDRILRENNKLQLEIQHKLKAINNVIDMLTGIIGDKKELEEKQRSKAEGKQEKKRPKTPPDTPPKSSSSSSSSPGHVKAPEPPPPGETEPPPTPVAPPPPPVAAPQPPPVEEKKPVFNYVHYDPEMHWCKVCDVFPRTAKEFLNHLHSSEHKEITVERKMVDMPWHKAAQGEEEVTYHKGAPTKRTPIRGLQFFTSATAWYCKLCDVWIGDLHCASLHLKSKTHTENYVNFTEQSPHWETDWLADREKAYERTADSRRQVKLPVPAPLLPPVQESVVVKEEKISKKNKKERKKEHKARDEKDGKKKKKKKRSKKKAKNSSASDSSSSSSSSDSSEDESDMDDKGKSIRVAMRNKMKALGSSGWEPENKEEGEKKARERLEEETREKFLKEMAEQQMQLEQQRLEQERYERQVMVDQEREKFRKVPQKEDKMLREWMGSGSKELPDGEKLILNSIKDRVKMRQEAERERKRDERDRYYEKGYYDDGNRRRRRGESPDSRSGKRGRSRSPDERRWDKSRGKYTKRSPQRGNQPRYQEIEDEAAERKNGDKKQAAKRPGSEPEEAETKFERQALEAAARLKKKDKKPATAAIPKSKLPFIGRMPIMKHLAKKKEDETIEVKKSADPSVLIGPVLPPNLLQSNLADQPDNKNESQPEELSIVQDMEIDDADSDDGNRNLVEEQVPVISYMAPVIEPMLPEMQAAEVDISHLAPPTLPELSSQEPKDSEEGKKPVNDIPLPKDFQEALNILFPGQSKVSDQTAKMGTPPPEWNQEVGYGMYPDYPPPLPMVQQKKTRRNTDSSSDEDDEHERFNQEMSGDDLAMLGIDVGDMAAQSF